MEMTHHTHHAGTVPRTVPRLGVGGELDIPIIYFHAAPFPATPPPFPPRPFIYPCIRYQIAAVNAVGFGPYGPASRVVRTSLGSTNGRREKECVCSVDRFSPRSGCRFAEIEAISARNLILKRQVILPLCGHVNSLFRHDIA